MWYNKEIYEIEKELKTNIKNGLSEKEASRRLNKNGKNELKEKKKKNALVRFLNEFNDAMIIILIVTSVISAITAKISGTEDYLDSIIIIAIVFFNALMGFIQEYKAEKSLEALKKMSSPTAMVRRDGKVSIIKTEDLVKRRYCNFGSWKVCTSGHTNNVFF